MAARVKPPIYAAAPQDMGSKAHTVDFIRKRLERELDQVQAAVCRLLLQVPAAPPSAQMQGCSRLCAAASCCCEHLLLLGVQTFREAYPRGASHPPAHSLSDPTASHAPVCCVQLRSTRGALSDVSGGGGQGVQLGVAGEPFSFEAHARARGVKVTTATVSGAWAGIGCFVGLVQQAAVAQGLLWGGGCSMSIEWTCTGHAARAGCLHVYETFGHVTHASNQSQRGVVPPVAACLQL